MNRYKVVAEAPTNRGHRFTQINGIGKGRKIWIDREKYPLNVIIGKLYTIKTNRDLDSKNIKNNQYIKLENFLILPEKTENSKY